MIGSKKWQRRSPGLRKFIDSLHANERRQRDNKALIRVGNMLSLQAALRDTGRYFDTRARRVILALYNQLLTLRTVRHDDARKS